jgi:oligoribonuclease
VVGRGRIDGGVSGAAAARRVTAVSQPAADRPQDRIVWIDCEMTGLDLVADALIEVAALVTDSELNVLGDGIDVVIKPPEAALEQMGDVVRAMHTRSGLLAELDAGLSMAEAEDAVLCYVRDWVSEPRRAPLAGNSVGTDRGFLARDMTALESYLHYRIVDVSSIKELARRWYPRVYFASPDKHGGHRALADIRESIAELRYYREALFVPLPGPDSDTARRIATRIRGGDPALPASQSRNRHRASDPAPEAAGGAAAPAAAAPASSAPASSAPASSAPAAAAPAPSGGPAEEAATDPGR